MIEIVKEDKTNPIFAITQEGERLCNSSHLPISLKQRYSTCKLKI